ncbi:MAG: sulfatase [Verrucomicrobiales bacterium]|nr:sulfatase [Verrucomicrobiales bacterium]
MRCLLFCCLLSTFGYSADKPDILMIAVDDLRPMLGCYGDKNIKTPNIDQLAASGTLFERAYCQYAKCGTSRLSLLTGLRPDAIGVFSNRDKDVADFRNQNPNLKPIGQWFKENGYITRSFGKIYHDGWDNPADWSEPAAPGRPGEMLEIVDPENPSGPTIIADRFACPVMQSPDVPDEHLFAGRMTRDVMSLIAEPSEKPRFIAIGYRRPHLPFVAPKTYYDLYQPDATWLTRFPSPPENVFPVAWFNSDGYQGAARKAGLTIPNPPNREQAIAWNGYEMRSYQGVRKNGRLTESDQLTYIHAYAACVSYIDAQIGKVMRALEKSKKKDNTVVVLWSDHGWHLGEHSAWGKMTNYEIATRVPLIFKGPGIQARRTSSFAELVDIYPTLCRLSRIEMPTHLEGDDISNQLIEAVPNSVKTAAYSQYSRYNGKYTGRAVRTDRFRYIAWYDRDKNLIAEEYYDAFEDPGETKNLIDQLDEDKIIECRSWLRKSK